MWKWSEGINTFARDCKFVCESDISVLITENWFSVEIWTNNHKQDISVFVEHVCTQMAPEQTSTLRDWDPSEQPEVVRIFFKYN